MTFPRSRGVFAGLATFDVIHRIDAPPGPDQKITARAQFVAAGGPAANAAVTFAALGGEAVLLTALGQGTIAETISAELRGQGVEVHDITPTLHDAAPVSAVSVLEATGERSVIGGDAAGLQAPRPETAAELCRRGATTVAVTAGAAPIRWWQGGRRGEIEVPQVRAVDTLGAGDVFHGAYAYALAAGADVETRLRYAAEVAAIRCSQVGPRSWLSSLREIPQEW